MVKLPHNEFCWSSTRQPDVSCKNLCISVGLFFNYKIVWTHNGNFKDFKINGLSVSTMEFLCVPGNFCRWVLPLAASLPRGSTSLRRKTTENISPRVQPREQVGCKSASCADRRTWAQPSGSVSEKWARHADTFVITAQGGRDRWIPGVRCSISVSKWTSSWSLNDLCQSRVRQCSWEVIDKVELSPLALIPACASAHTWTHKWK